MNFHIEGSIVSIPVDFVDQAGVKSEPVSAVATLYDGDEVEIAAIGPLAWVQGETSVMLSIPSANNMLTGGDKFEVRILKVVLTYPDGDVNIRKSYIIEANIQLSIMENSFMNYEYANIVSRDFVSPIGWALSDEGTRKTALIQAYRRITKIPMKWTEIDDDGNIINSSKTHIDTEMWEEMDSDNFASFSTQFKRVLRRAQFIEANELLQGDDIAKKRRSGIIEETVGESSTKFNDSMIDYGVSSETLIALTGYIHFSTRIGRA